MNHRIIFLLMKTRVRKCACAYEELREIATEWFPSEKWYQTRSTCICMYTSITWHVYTGAHACNSVERKYKFRISHFVNFTLFVSWSGQNECTPSCSLIVSSTREHVDTRESDRTLWQGARFVAKFVREGWTETTAVAANAQQLDGRRDNSGKTPTKIPPEPRCNYASE